VSEDPLADCGADFMKGLQADCESLGTNCCRLLRMAGRACSGAAVVELIRSVPATLGQVGACPEDSFFHRCVVAASLGPHDPAEFLAVVDYFKAMMAMPHSRRCLLEASLAGVVLGMGW
jgi:hypothetical protein